MDLDERDPTGRAPLAGPVADRANSINGSTVAGASAVRDALPNQRIAEIVATSTPGTGNGAGPEGANETAQVISTDATSGSRLDISAAVAAARTGDEDAFRVVYRAIQPGLLRYLKALVGEDAEDVASEAWSQIARDMGSFSGNGDGFRGWAATIARHRALDLLRSQRRKPAVAYQIDDLVDQAASDDTAESAVEAVTTDAAIALIATLPPDQAEAVLLRVVMGLDANTAGQVLGKRAGAVRTAAHRGLRRLAERLNQPPAE